MAVGIALSSDVLASAVSAYTYGKNKNLDIRNGLIMMVCVLAFTVVRCNGTCANRPRVNQNDGAKSCAIAASLYGGETGCSYGCLGCGDCVAACQFDAIHMNPETGLPEVDEEKCTACGACAKACPKSIIEIRPQGKKSRRIYVQCVKRTRGP